MLIAAWGAWTLTRHSGRTPLLLSWVASGFLFAWGSWKAVFSFEVTPEFPPPEQPWLNRSPHPPAALPPRLPDVPWVGKRGKSRRRR